MFANVQIWEAIIFYFPHMRCQEIDRAEWALPHVQCYRALKNAGILQKLQFTNSVLTSTLAVLNNCMHCE